MTSFSVSIETRAPQGAGPLADPEERMDDLMDLIADHGGVCSANATSWDTILTVETEDAEAAHDQGVSLIHALAVKAGLPTWPIVHAEVIRTDVLEEELAYPNVPDLVSGPEAAEILGVSRQRVHQLATENKLFPKPLYQLGVGSLWTRAAVEKFAAEWTRKPGRPRKQVKAR